jgi:integrase
VQAREGSSMNQEGRSWVEVRERVRNDPWMVDAGEHPNIVAERLGHTSTQVTLITYSHVAEGMQSRAAKSIAAAVFR